MLKIGYTLGVLFLLPVVIVVEALGAVWGSVLLIWDAWK